MILNITLPLPYINLVERSFSSSWNFYFKICLPNAI